MSLSCMQTPELLLQDLQEIHVLFMCAFSSRVMFQLPPRLGTTKWYCQWMVPLPLTLQKSLLVRINVQALSCLPSSEALATCTVGQVAWHARSHDGL